MIRLLAGVVLALVAGSAAAAPIPVYSTGMGGPFDSHYTITSAPAPYIGPASIITTPDSAFPFAGSTASSWADSTLNPGGYPASAWIGPLADVEPISSFIEPGLYVYTTSFDMTGLDAATALISGIVAADNEVDIYLNGNFVTGFHYPDYIAYSDDRFPLQTFLLNSGFLPGMNTLQFYVYNGDGGDGDSPTGLRVALSGSADPLTNVPEPASLALFGLLAGGVALARRRFIN